MLRLVPQGSLLRRRATGTLFRFSDRVAGSSLMPNALRLRVHRALGLQLGDVGLRAHCCFTGSDVTIGDGTWIHRGALIDAEGAPVWIGRDVGIGPGVMLITSTHEIGASRRRGGRPIGLPIRIEDGCWLGARVTVMPGVTIARGCVVAAGAVVTADCTADGLYAGVPARRIRELDGSKLADRLAAAAS